MTSPAFDPDAYLNEQATQGAPAFDPDAYLNDPEAGKATAAHAITYDANLFRKRVGRDPEPAELANFKAFKGVGWAGDPTQGKFTMGQAGIGALEDAVSMGTGAVAAVPAAAGYMAGAMGAGDSKQNARAVRKALTYQPRTEAGQAGLAEIGQISQGPVETLAHVGDLMGHKGLIGDTVRDVAERVGDVAPLFGLPGLVKGIGRIAGDAGTRLLNSVPDTEAPLTTEQVAGQTASSQSMGAAGTAANVADASPQLQQAITAAARNSGGAVNRDALINHLEADQHGIKLTEGQATRNPVTFSNEQNSTHPEIVSRLGGQNQKLVDALDNVRREATPAMVQNDPIENGQTAVDSLKAYDEPIRADIDAKYAAARKASAKGDLQMDGSSFVDDANRALKPQSKFRFLPGTVKGILDDVANADGRMSLDDFQAYSTQIGNEIAKARAAGDGNAVAAITKVNEALQRTNPIGEETIQAKNLFDTARAAAKARFDELDSDPAYRAAVDDVSLNSVRRGEPSALADKFLDKYALQAPKANVDRLMGKLDADGQQAVTAHALSTIRKSSVTPNGNITPSGFNSALGKYGPKLESLVPDQATRESLDSLGRVITNVKSPPPGHFVNYSKSGVISNAASGTARELGEAIVNSKTFGMGVPIIKGIAENNFAKRVLAPGAGLNRLTVPP